MKFTQYLKLQFLPERKASFIDLVKHDSLWPAESDRLEDFEDFMFARLEEEGAKLIPELRGLWHDYATHVGRTEGKHDLDLALAAWADYAQHRRECTLSQGESCGTEEELFEVAMEASGFDDRPERPRLPCGEGEDSVEDLVDLFEDGERSDEEEERDEEWDHLGEWEPSVSHGAEAHC